MSRQYVDQYGVRLLDDLHNYFPAVLYDPTQFQTVPALLAYIRERTQSQFNPFQSGLREYQATYITHPLPRQPRVNPLQSTRGGRARERTNNNRIVTETYEFIPSLVSNIYSDLEIPILIPPYASSASSDPIPMLVPAPASASASASANLGPARLESTLANSIFDTALVRALLSLNPSQNLEPVIVRPTQQQIDRATALRAAVAIDESESCSVCQERYTEGQALRVIHHCHHQFHKDCVDRWFERNVRCPVCRHDVRVPNAASASTTTLS